eukprot:scaffold13329_cov31-Tisochrysis_lutea.AAC.2
MTELTHCCLCTRAGWRRERATSSVVFSGQEGTVSGRSRSALGRPSVAASGVCAWCACSRCKANKVQRKSAPGSVWGG